VCLLDCLVNMSDSDETDCLALIEPGKCMNGMNEEDVRRILGRRVIGDDEIVAVGVWFGFVGRI
jgi:hypothetical protein